MNGTEGLPHTLERLCSASGTDDVTLSDVSREVEEEGEVYEPPETEGEASGSPEEGEVSGPEKGEVCQSQEEGELPLQDKRKHVNRNSPSGYDAWSPSHAECVTFQSWDSTNTEHLGDGLGAAYELEYDRASHCDVRTSKRKHDASSSYDVWSLSHAGCVPFERSDSTNTEPFGDGLGASYEHNLGAESGDVGTGDSAISWPHDQKISEKGEVDPFMKSLRARTITGQSLCSARDTDDVILSKDDSKEAQMEVEVFESREEGDDLVTLMCKLLTGPTNDPFMKSLQALASAGCHPLIDSQSQPYCTADGHLLPLLAASSLQSEAKEVIDGKGKRRAEDKDLLEAHPTPAKPRCYNPNPPAPSERQTATSFSLDLDTVVKVIQIISRQYNDQEHPRSIPKVFRGLCHETDKVAGCNMRFNNAIADGRQKVLVENSSYPVVGVTSSNGFNMGVTLPYGVRKVKFGAAYNQPTDLPRSVVDATFGHDFNQPVVLPPLLRNVQFGFMYNQPVDLPESLRDVHFGNNFDQLVTLPRGLQKVSFGTLFRKALGPLPPKLEEISFKKWWNHDIVLPDTIHKCKFGQRYEKLVRLGPNVEEFHLGFNQPLPDPLPFSLKNLKVHRKRLLRMPGLEDLVPLGCEITRVPTTKVGQL